MNCKKKNFSGFIGFEEILYQNNYISKFHQILIFIFIKISKFISTYKND